MEIKRNLLGGKQMTKSRNKREGWYQGRYSLWAEIGRGLGVSTKKWGKHKQLMKGHQRSPRESSLRGNSSW